MKRYKDQLAVVSGLLDETLGAITSMRESGYTPPEGLLRELQAYAVAQQAIAGLAGVGVQAKDSMLNDDEILQKEIDNHVIVYTAMGSNPIELVYWRDKDWRCPVCGSEELAVHQGTTAEVLRPYPGSKRYIAMDISVSCPHCPYDGTVGEAALEFHRDQHDLPPSSKIQSLRDRL